MRLQWVGCCIRLLAGFCLAGALFTATPAHADQLSRLYQQILRNPENIELNLRYAELALEHGQRRKALAAYERILDVDPDNRDALEGLRRITVGLTPTTTRGRIEVGARWESNVRELPKTTNRPDDFIGFAKLFVSDERPLFHQVWLSDLWAYADLHEDVSALDYWIARGHTGPVFDIGGNATLHIAPGGTIAFLDADYFYAEAALKVTFEQLFGGGLDLFQVRGGLRDIGDRFTPSNGVAIDVIAREAFRGVFTDADSFIVQPFFRWREADNIGNNVFGLPTSFLMGDYIEAGGTLMYFVYVEEDIRLGGKFTAHYRDYEQNTATLTNNDERYDYYIMPEAEVLFRDVVCDGCDLRFRYRFEQNFSNDNTEDFINHSIIASGVRRF